MKGLTYRWLVAYPISLSWLVRRQETEFPKSHSPVICGRSHSGRICSQGHFWLHKNSSFKLYYGASGAKVVGWPPQIRLGKGQYPEPTSLSSGANAYQSFLLPPPFYLYLRKVKMLSHNWPPSTFLADLCGLILVLSLFERKFSGGKSPTCSRQSTNLFIKW